MQENVGNVDRWLRVAVGGALVLGAVRALALRKALRPGLLLAGAAVALQTALTRVCPLNAALARDTRGWIPLRRLGGRSGSSRGELRSRSEYDWGAPAA